MFTRDNIEGIEFTQNGNKYKIGERFNDTQLYIEKDNNKKFTIYNITNALECLNDSNSSWKILSYSVLYEIY